MRPTPSEIVWRELEPTIEARIEALGKATLRDLLKGVRLISNVTTTSLEWNER